MKLNQKYFSTYQHLCDFVNDNYITPQQIQHIRFNTRGTEQCTLFYWTFIVPPAPPH
jgi:hypothetical protein